MYKFGTKSKKQLETCHSDLQKIANEAIKYVDFSIVEGHRGKLLQDKAYAEKKSKIKWPNGKHNKKPSEALDFVPYPIDWSNKTTALTRFTFVAGVIHKVAKDLGIKIRFGWDWNKNLDPRDESFLDWGHLELID